MQWERSLDGTNWYPEESENSTYEDGRFSKGPYDPAMSGLRYRAYAWAYEQYTNLPNYQQGQSTSAVETVAPGTWYDRNDVRPYGRVYIISSKPLSYYYSFMFVRQGSFRINMDFNGIYSASGTDSSFYTVACYIGSRFVVYINNKPGEEIAYADFDAYPGEIMSFDFRELAGSAPNPTYGFEIVSKTTNVPYVGSKVASTPFTLTVRQGTSSSSSSSRLFSSSSSSSSSSPPNVRNPGP